jgi:DNA polymerase (family 10)
MHLKLDKKMSNQEIAETFKFISGVLSLTDTNVFRVRAYQNAASVIEQLPEELHHMFLNNPDFDKLPGIGDTLHQKLTELFTTGTIKAFEEYVKDIPEAVWPLVQLHGLGVKKSYALAKAFKLDSAKTALADLRQHAEAGHVRGLPGFGEKSEKELIVMLTSSQPKGDRFPYAEAAAIAEQILNELKKCPAIVNCEPLGSLRRHTPTVGDIDIGLVTTDIGLVKDCVKNMKNVERILASGEQVIRALLKNGRQVDFKTVPPEEWGAFLQHYSGSKEHNIKLREYALDQGKSLSEHGIKYFSDAKPLTADTPFKVFANEIEFYNELGLAWIPPQQRLGGDEIRLAQQAFKAGKKRL